MKHNTTVTPEQFAALQARQRHLICKHDPLFMPGDTLLVSQPDSREQLEFVIQSATKENINQKGDLTLLSLFAPYAAIDDLQGLFTKNASQQGAQC